MLCDDINLIEVKCFKNYVEEMYNGRLKAKLDKNNSVLLTKSKKQKTKNKKILSETGLNNTPTDCCSINTGVNSYISLPLVLSTVLPGLSFPVFPGLLFMELLLPGLLFPDALLPGLLFPDALLPGLLFHEPLSPPLRRTPDTGALRVNLNTGICSISNSSCYY
jgi:hypothetical protein